MTKTIYRRFNEQTKPKVLFHATIHDVGNIIQSQFNWTCTRQEYGAFVFGGVSLESAYLYTIKTKGCYCTGNTEDLSYMIFSNRNDFYKENPRGFIHPVPASYFEPVQNSDGHGFTGEWIARRSVPVDPANVIRVNGIEDVMSRAHQVFFLRRPLNKEEHDVLNNNPSTPELARLIQSGALHWENQERNIKPAGELYYALFARHQQTIFPKSEI